MSIVHDLNNAAVATDAAWMRAIREAFPNKRAGDVRYTIVGKGEPGTALRAAFDAHAAANEAWRAAITAERNAKAAGGVAC